MRSSQPSKLLLLLALTGAMALASTLGACREQDIEDHRKDAGHDAGIDGGGDAGGDAGDPWWSRDGGQAVLSVASWNMEWFGDSANAPSDDALQYANARNILRDGGFDVWGLVEVVNVASWNALLGDLPEYRGILASDTTAVLQPSTCSSYAAPCYSSTEQKPALLYRPDVLTIRGAQLLLTAPAYNYELGGRPPLRVDARMAVNGQEVDVVFIVLHFKAYATYSDWERRAASSRDLKAYLDDNLPGQKVIVMGDWNDDVDRSTARDGGSYLPTPFQNFLDDSTHYTFVTKVLTDQGLRSEVNYPNVIDHHLVTDPLAERPHLAEVVRPDLWGDPGYAGSSYASTTSDHYPILSRYLLAGDPDGGSDAGGP